MFFYFNNALYFIIVFKASFVLKGAAKLYFEHYLRVVMVLFSTGLFIFYLLLYKTRFMFFSVFNFSVSVSLVFRFMF